MNNLIFVVEDELPFLFNVKGVLEEKGYKVITAQDGLEAINLLKKQEILPDLIISDVIMPHMNGYDFFKQISSNSQWTHIPFIFLSVLSLPKDNQWGKMFGDGVDHITKPYKEEDLLAKVANKLTRNKYKCLGNNVKIGNHGKKTSIKLGNSAIVLFFMCWSDKIGPFLKDHFPFETNQIDLPYSLERIGFQLFNGVNSIYGQEKMGEPQDILVNIPFLKRTAYIFFDSIEDQKVRGKVRPYILSVLAPKIHHSESIELKKIFRKLSFKIKTGNRWSIENAWKEVSHLLITPPLSSLSTKA